MQPDEQDKTAASNLGSTEEESSLTEEAAVPEDPNSTVADRRKFLRNATTAAAALAVGGATLESAQAQRAVLPAGQLKAVRLPKANVSLKLQSLEKLPNAQEIAKNAMLLKAIELVDTLGPGDKADFNLNFSLGW